MDTREFISRLTAAVNEYIDGEESYGDDVQVEINTTDWSMDIADPENDLPNCDYYPVMDLVRMSSSNPGQWEADDEAITDVAAEYVFTD